MSTWIILESITKFSVKHELYAKESECVFGGQEVGLTEDPAMTARGLRRLSRSYVYFLGPKNAEDAFKNLKQKSPSSTYISPRLSRHIHHRCNKKGNWHRSGTRRTGWSQTRSFDFTNLERGRTILYRTRYRTLSYRERITRVEHGRTFIIHADHNPLGFLASGRV